MRKFVLLACFFVGLAFSQMPSTMMYQGKLTDDLGIGINSTEVMTFKIYDDELGGSELWAETHLEVTILRGLFYVELGSVTPIGLAFDEQYWLQIAVGGDVMNPRQKLAVEAYAFHARYAEELIGGDMTIETRDTMIAHWDSIRGIPPEVWDDGDWIMTGDNLHPLTDGNIGIGIIGYDGPNKVHIVSNGELVSKALLAEHYGTTRQGWLATNLYGAYGQYDSYNFGSLGSNGIGVYGMGASCRLF